MNSSALNMLAQQNAEGALKIEIGKSFHLEQMWKRITDGRKHAGEKIVVVTRPLGTWISAFFSEFSAARVVDGCVRANARFRAVQTWKRALVEMVVLRKPRSEFRPGLWLTTELNPISEAFGHPCVAHQHLQRGNELPERRGRALLVVDSVCRRNTAEFCRVGSEEVLQSLRTASRDGANCTGNVASLLIALSFR
jgi:hypothetical protein